MKKVKLHIQRKAIAMIELIFAIVIMGIVLLSIPNLISIATKSGYISLQQEAIATAASQINLLLTKHWDENNVIDTSTGIDGTVILDTNGTASLTLRPGAKSRSRVSPSSATFSATPIGSEGNDFDDIDDAHGMTMSLRNFSNTQVTDGDNIDTNISITATIDYVTDATSGTSTPPPDYNNSKTIQYNFSNTPAGTITNIKAISTHLTTNNPVAELTKDISLKAFSANIGSYKPARRQMP